MILETLAEEGKESLFINEQLVEMGVASSLSQNGGLSPFPTTCVALDPDTSTTVADSGSFTESLNFCNLLKDLTWYTRRN